MNELVKKGYGSYGWLRIKNAIRNPYKYLYINTYSSFLLKVTDSSSKK